MTNIHEKLKGLKAFCVSCSLRYSAEYMLCSKLSTPRCYPTEHLKRETRKVSRFSFFYYRAI